MLLKKALGALALLCFSLAACGETNSPVESETGGLSLSAAKRPTVDASAAAAYLDQVNARLSAEGSNMRVAYAEYVTGGPDAHAEGQIVFANDRELRLSSRWVPFDPVRERDETLSYLVYQPLALANGTIDAEPSIDAALATWEDVTCSRLDIVKIPDTGVFPSAVLGGDFSVADIIDLGFLPGTVFDQFLGAGASTSVLGVTFTAIWVDVDTGVPTDFDGNGHADTALAEVWYNDDFAWSTTEEDNTTDIETVAFHENGHALGLGHYGKIFGTFANLKLHVAPRAAMNAFIFGTLREPLGTDNAGYCGIYGQWPN